MILWCSHYSSTSSSTATACVVVVPLPPGQSCSRDSCISSTGTILGHLLRHKRRRSISMPLLNIKQTRSSFPCVFCCRMKYFSRAQASASRPRFARSVSISRANRLCLTVAIKTIYCSSSVQETPDDEK